MLGVIGAGSVASLFDAIPKNVRAKSFDLPEGVSEFEALDYFAGLSMKKPHRPCLLFRRRSL